ncbi:hypothetical protein SALBM311S_00086 [Streptomyces alboniger]
MPRIALVTYDPRPKPSKDRDLPVLLARCGACGRAQARPRSGTHAGRLARSTSP